MNMEDLRDKIKDRPFLSLLLVACASGVTVLGAVLTLYTSNTYATNVYVDREIKEVKDSLGKVKKDLEGDLVEIKNSVMTTEQRVYDMWKITNKKDH